LQAIKQNDLPAETFMSTIPINVPVEVPSVIEVAPHLKPVAITAAETSIVPPARNPISISLVAGHPNISRSRARRNVSYRSARVNPRFSCLSRRCSQAQRASRNRRT
jgi:hypothetical protein